MGGEYNIGKVFVIKFVVKIFFGEIELIFNILNIKIYKLNLKKCGF